MDCPTEEGLIRKKLNGMKGVSGLQFNLMNRVLTVSYPKGMLPEIVAAIKSLDYTPEVLEAHEKPKLSNSNRTKIAWWKYILRVLCWQRVPKPVSTSACPNGFPLRLQSLPLR